MSSPKPYALGALLQLIFTLVLLSIALGTRGWLRGYIRYGIQFVNVDAGLFQVYVLGDVFEVNQFFPGYKDEIRTTIILEGVGGSLVLLSTICLVILMLGKHHLLFEAVSIFSAFISGIFLLAGPAYFSINVAGDIEPYKFYSWYLALLSSFFAFSTVGSVTKASHNGEFRSEPTDRIENQIIVNYMS